LDDVTYRYSILLLELQTHLCFVMRFGCHQSGLLLLLRNHDTHGFQHRKVTNHYWTDSSFYVDTDIGSCYSFSSNSRLNASTNSAADTNTDTPTIDDQVKLDWEMKQIGQGHTATTSRHSLDEWIKGTFFEQYWQTQLPPLFASSDDGGKSTLLIDGCSFLGRMAMLKYLIQDWESAWFNAASNPSDLEKLWGSSSYEGHWLWAYGAQLDWQHRSRRLARPSASQQEMVADEISMSSWWGYMNFCFSVAVVLGAVNARNAATANAMAGGMLHVEMDKESQKLLDDDSACRDCVGIWQDLFQRVYPDYSKKIQSLKMDNRLTPKEIQLLRFRFQQEVWKAHTSVIETALASPRSNSLLMKLPEPEQKFGLGWARMVDILAASTFPTDLVTLVQDGTGFLPFSVITDQTFAGWKDIDRQSDKQLFAEKCHERGVLTTHRLVDLDDKIFAKICGFWKRVVRVPEESRNMPQRVNCLVHGPFVEKLKEIVKIMGMFVLP
jgi:Leg1